MVILLERKYIYFGIFLFIFGFIIIWGYNSFAFTFNSYTDGNISFQYPLGFQNSSPFPDLYDNVYSMDWDDVVNLNGSNGAGISVQKSAANDSDIETLGSNFTQFFRDTGDNIVSSSKITNPNGVDMWKIVHIAKKDNYNYVFYDVYFIQADNVYFIQILGEKDVESSVQQTADAVFNSTKVLK